MAKTTIRERVAKIRCPHCGKPVTVRDRAIISESAMADFSKEMGAAGEAITKAMGHVGEAVTKIFKTK